MSGLVEQENIHEICPDQRLQSLFSMINMSCNNLLDMEQASQAWELIGKNNNRVVFNALISGQSPAAKAIARNFLPAAIEASDIAMVRKFLDTGIDLNGSLDYIGDTPLLLASRRGYLEIIRCLLDRGADSNVVNFSGETPLVEAVIAGRMESVKLLLRCGANANFHVGHGGSPLGYAVSRENLEMIEMLLIYGADPNRRCTNQLRPNISPLEIAASRGNLELVELLLCHGADLHARYRSNGLAVPTVLHQAISLGSLPVIQLLLDSGADATEALPYAVRRGDLNLVQKLIDLGADIEAYSGRTHETGFRTMTALQMAANLGKHAIVWFLLNSGATINAAAHEKCGMTALQAAASNGDRELVQTLLSFGAELNAVPAKISGSTALQAAIMSRRIDLVRFLVESGADVNGPPAVEYGITALEAAALEDFPELVHLLLDSHVDLKVQGGPAVARAISIGCFDMLKLLLSYGANVNDTYIDWDSGYSSSALELAVEALNPEDALTMTELLLTHGANDKTGALLIAAAEGHFKVAKLLLSCGADVNYGFRDGTDRTALSEATRAGDSGMVHLLLDHGADGTSAALQAAVRSGDVDVVHTLLSAGADVNTPPADIDSKEAPMTALQIAAKTGSADLVRLLLDAGARPDIDPSLKEEGTALQFAAMGGHIDIARELVNGELMLMRLQEDMMVGQLLRVPLNMVALILCSFC